MRSGLVACLRRCHCRRGCRPAVGRPYVPPFAICSIPLRVSISRWALVRCNDRRRFCSVKNCYLREQTKSIRSPVLSSNSSGSSSSNSSRSGAASAAERETTAPSEVIATAFWLLRCSELPVQQARCCNEKTTL